MLKPTLTSVSLPLTHAATLFVMLGMITLGSPATAQVAAWNDPQAPGPNGSVRYQGLILGFEFGASLTPPWHHFRQSPADNVGSADAAALAAQRYYHDLDRMHRYQTREDRYASDFHNRYASGDPLYHSYRGTQAPHSMAHYPPSTSSVPGIAFSHDASHPHSRRSIYADEVIPDLLRAAANRLISSLSRMRDGQVWMDHLQPRRIIASIDRAEYPGSLTDLIAAYDVVVHNPRLVLIARANGFADVHQLLIQYVRLESRYPGSTSVIESDMPVEGSILYEETLPENWIPTPLPETIRPETLRPETLRPETLRPESLRPEPAAAEPWTPADRDPSQRSDVEPDAVAKSEDRSADDDSVMLNRPVLDPPTAPSVFRPRLPQPPLETVPVATPAPRSLEPEVDPTLQVTPNDLPPVQWLPKPIGTRE